jgi:hypothetical protein
MTDIASILDRARQAMGPDREIDAEIYRLVYDGGWTSRIITLPAYTGSLDAIIGLIEAKLPGWNMAVWIDEEPQANLYPKAQPFPAEMDIYESGETPALALTCAFLQAWESVK